IIVTNPLDAMAYAAYKLSGFPASRVIGSGTLLDTMRFRQIIGNRFGIDSSCIEALVVGEHGESMVPLWSGTKVCGTPLQDYLGEKGIELTSGIKEEINRETERAGWNIRLGNVHTCYGIALSAIKIIECILGFSDEVVPVSTLLKGEYGFSNIFASVPVKLDRKGIKSIEAIDMTSDEKKLLAESCGILESYIQAAGDILKSENL
ncbi:MAG TPA: L-lactate dehydrogenase, partial [Negativicutes bacterium]|nr:L-lactate dehydrogenase [Negativicutes bacterium]